MKKVCFAFICYVFFIYSANSQNSKRQYLKFEVENKVYVDEWEYEGMQYEYNVIKIYLNDSIFLQKYIFDLKDETYNRVDTFKVVNNRWKYKYNGTFYPYIDKSSFINNKPIVYKIEESGYFEFNPLQLHQDSSLFEFEKLYITPITTNRISTVLFDEKKGIVKENINGIGLMLIEEGNMNFIEVLEGLRIKDK